MNKLDTIRELVALSLLEENWDSYGAKPINRSAIVTAIAIVLEHMPDDLPRPSVVPTRDSGIQFEWDIVDAYLEITVDRDCFVSVERGVRQEHVGDAFAWLMQQAKAKEET